jgi:hypothetical protein
MCGDGEGGSFVCLLNDWSRSRSFYRMGARHMRDAGAGWGLLMGLLYEYV